MSVISKAVIQFRQRRKKWAVDAFGGKCGICGYDKSIQALHFHHLDPNKKDFAPSTKVVSRELFVKELKKCVCICANCHSEVHAGITKIPNNILKFNNSFTNKPLPKKPRHPCNECGKLTIINQKFCSVKCSRKGSRVIDWPNNKELKRLIIKNGYCGTGRMLGVSDSAIRKHLKRKKFTFVI